MEISDEEFNLLFAVRIRGIRKALDLLMEKVGLKFCMRCFTEIKGEVYTLKVKGILGEERTVTLCEKCYGETRLAR